MAHRIDGPGATEDSLFTAGDPTSGTEATEVTADFLNMVQEEIAGVVEGAGDTLDKANNGQLLAAINELIAAAVPTIGAATEEAQGIVELATEAEAIAGTDTVRAVTPAGVKAAIAANGVSLETILMYS